jgi:putative hemolysin
MRLIRKIVHPILRFLNRLFRYPPGKKGSGPADENDISSEEIESFTQTPESALEEEERRMIHGVVELGETEVKEIMHPRPDMICAEEGFTLDQIRELVIKHGHSRFPLYRENIDNITGIIYIKDIFLLTDDQGKVIKLSSLARKAYFIPETKKDKIHMAIVVDEYGGTAGLVTLEDILEEIVGEIQDEYDKELPPIQKLNENTYRVDAGVSIEDLNETLGTKIKEKGFETVGGFIYDLVGGVPELGKKLEHVSGQSTLSLLVEKVEGQRIKTVKVTVVSPSRISPKKPSHHE